MSWGHAVSKDMLRWKHLELALPEEEGIMMYSGSAVIDWNNTSGFGKNGEPPMVAIYTGHTATHQQQAIAYSNDKGRTWTKYSGNPVIPSKRKHFRDPKVLWHEDTQSWIMIVVLADERKARFYGSPDLKEWTLLSTFGPEGAFPVRNWECPDLFELPVENLSGQSRWVFQVDSGDGHPAGGSGCQYFVGDFDGKRFVSENPGENTMWVDHGADFYAAQTWSDVPESDGRRLMLAWMNNWSYARQVPTNPWRGAQSLAREVSLRAFDEGIRLKQKPIREIDSLRGQHVTARGVSVAEANAKVESLKGETLEIKVELELSEAAEVGMEVRVGGDEKTRVGYTQATEQVWVDRTESGKVDFNENFSGVHSARLKPANGRVRLHVIVDASSVEVFANDGRVALTDRIFPSSNSRGWSLFGEDAKVVRLDAWKLKSAWTD